MNDLATYKQITDSGLQSISVHECLDITFHTLTNAQNPLTSLLKYSSPLMKEKNI